MKKINLLVCTVFCLFIIQGCSEWEEEMLIPLNDQMISLSGEENSPESESLLLKSAGKQKYKFSGTLNVWSDPPPPGREIMLEVDGRGNLTHMGKSKISMKKTVRTYAYPEPPRPWEVFAELVLTAANGDQLFFSFDFCKVDLSKPPNFTFKADCVITGGTGRYSKASGHVEYFETFSWEEAKGTLYLSGELNF